MIDDEVVKLNHDGIHAKLASIDISYEPRMFAAAIPERAHMSHVSMALGSVSIDDTACDIFMGLCNVDYSICHNRRSFCREV